MRFQICEQIGRATKRYHALWPGTVLAASLLAAVMGLGGCASDAGVVIEPDSSSDTIWVRIMFNAGSVYDPPGREGTALLTARHLARPADGSDALAARSPGTDLEFAVDREVVHFDLKCLRGNWETASEELVGRLAGAAFDGETLTGLVTAQRSDIDAARGDDAVLARSALQSRLYRGHPYGRPPFGTDTSLSAITAAELTSFYKTHYTASNMSLGFAGSITDEMAVTFRERLRASLPHGPAVSPPDLPAAAVAGVNAYLIEMPDPNPAALYLGFPTGIVRGDTNFAAWYLACSYLGRHGGRLAELLDDQRNISYVAWSYVEHVEPYTETDLLTTGRPRRAQYFSIETQPHPINQQFVVRIVLSELATMRDSGIPPAELEKTRACLIGKIAAERKRAVNRMRQRLDDLWLGTKGFSAHLADELRDVTPAQANAAARLVFDPANLQIVAVCGDGQTMATMLLSNQTMSQYPEGINRSLLRAADNAYLSCQPAWDPKRMRIIKAEEMFR